MADALLLVDSNPSRSAWAIWRVGGGLDRLPAVFSNGAAPRIPLCPRGGAVSQAAARDGGARGPAGGERGGVAHLPGIIAEQAGDGRPDVGYSEPARGNRGPAVFSTVHHRSAAAGVVRAAIPEQMPYRLYALSNAGLCFALLSYPVLFEPTLTSHQQAGVWSVAFGVFLILCAFTAFGASKYAPVEAAVEDAAARKPAARQYALWLLLPAVASLLLLAITNHLSQNVAAIPLL